MQVTGMQESENFCASCLPELCVELDGIWHTVEECWFDESHADFILSDQY